jgi:peptidylprolyl isomerase
MNRPQLVVTTLLALTAASTDPVVAVRGHDEITASQARALIAAADPDTRQRLKSDPASISNLVRDTLLQHAILAEAEATHFEDQPQIAALLRRAREQVLLQTYLAAHAQVPAGYPSDADIQAAYDQSKAQLMQPRGYHLVQATIVVPAGGASTGTPTGTPTGTSTGTPYGAAEARRKLAELQHEATRGHATLESAAKTMPGVQITDLGWQPENHLLPAAKEVAAGLLEGQISPPICTANGCAILKLVATRPAGPAPLAEARDTLVRALRQQKQRQEEAAYESALLAKQPVQVNEIELSHLAGQ